MSKFTISEYQEPVVEFQKRARSEFTRKVTEMPVGKAIVIDGMSRANVSSRVNQIKLREKDDREYTTQALEGGKVQVVRIK